MSSSNMGKLRKKTARLVESEILTINIELQELLKIKEIDFKSLKILDYVSLKSMRQNMQDLKIKIGHINSDIRNLTKPSSIYSDGMVIIDGQKVFVDSREYRIAKKSDEEFHTTDAEDIEISESEDVEPKPEINHDGNPPITFLENFISQYIKNI